MNILALVVSGQHVSVSGQGSSEVIQWNWLVAIISVTSSVISENGDRETVL